MAFFGVEGYFLKTLDNKECVLDVREKFEKLLHKMVSRDATLETYHNFVSSDDKQVKIHYELSQLFWDGQWHLEIFKKNKVFFDEMLGPDLDIQTKPHFRLVRPQKEQDNIGFHRDVEYGATAYEVSCLYTLTKLNALGAIQLIPGSHSLTKVKVSGIKNEDVEKGSVKHQLGVPYFLQTLDDDSLRPKLIPIPMEVGEVLCCSLAVIHGQEVNRSSNTRWTIDARAKNTFVKSGSRDDYYINLHSSPATKAGIMHYKKNIQAK
jgi:hypothetical protein